MMRWLVDVVVGGIVGAILGGIVAVNIMIFSGAEKGYETGLAELFAYNAGAGLLFVAALIGGPIVGVVVARGLRRHRQTRV